MKKERLPLIVGVGLPLLLIAYVAISTYITSIFIKPKYSFIYTKNYNHDQNINVIEGKIKIIPVSTNTAYSPPVSSINFYKYDVLSDKNTAISSYEAETYTLDPSDKSPDGFIVGRSEGRSSFLYGGYDNTIYLKGNGLRRKVVENSYDFKFLGWILNG